MADDIIKQFVVALDYKVNKGSEKDFERSVQAATKNVMAFAAAAAAMAAAAVVAVEKVARSFDDLYFASRRTGASVENIKALGFAFSQVGGSADSGRSAIENFARALRTNPGTKTLLNDLGIATTKGGKVRDTVEMMLDLQKAFAKRPHYINAQYGSILGLSEEDVRLIESGQLVGRMKEYEATAREIGLNHERAAKNGFEFERALGSLRMTAGALADKIASDLQPALTKFTDEFTAWLKDHHQEVEDAFTAFATAVRETATAFKDLLLWLKPAWEAFDKLSESLLGQKGLTTAFEALGAVLALKVLAPLTRISALILGMASLPAWLSAALGIGVGVVSTGHGFQTPEQAAANPDQAATNAEANGRVGGIKSWWKRTMPGFLGGGTSSDGKPALPAGQKTGAGHVATQAERAAYIRRAAIARGIDPEVALRVAQSEGFNSYVGDKGTSFGDWQLHVKNNIPGLSLGGLGDTAIKKGIDIRDPKTWKEQTDFALDQAAKGGWGPWHGAARAGIGNRQGIGLPIPKPKAFNLPPNLGDPGNGAFGASPLTSPGAMTNNNVHMVHTTNIKVEGSGDPSEVANKIAGSQDRLSSRMLRNAQGAIR